jgi:hypothetical protein
MRAEILLAHASSTYENPGWSYRYYRSFSRGSKKGKINGFDTEQAVKAFSTAC